MDNFASFKTLVDHYKSQQENNNDGGETIVICAGDFLSPSLLSSLDKGYSMVDILNEVGVDYVCFGNHEADVTNTDLTARIEQSNFEWINSNIPNLNQCLNVRCPQYKILNISNNLKNNKKIGLLGFCTEDPALYRPDSFGGATITPIQESIRHWQSELLSKQQKEDCCDILLCMTHQGIDADRSTAKEFGGNHQIPLLLGGHDHEPYHEVVENGCHIVKTGMNADRAAIIDIHWTEEQRATRPSISIQMIETNQFQPDPKIQRRIEAYQDIIKQLDEAKLFTVRDWVDTRMKDEDDNVSSQYHYVFSTKDNRLGFSTGTVAFCSVLRMGLRCELCLLNAGCVRGGKEYHDDDDFTWSDLKAEIPFATRMSTCKIPGRVIQETINYSRQWAINHGIAKGGYIHVSRCCVTNEDTGAIETVSGEPFDPNREYLTAFPYCFLQGIDNHEPLLEWAKSQSEEVLPKENSAIPAKFVFVEFLSAILWLRLGNFEELAGDDGTITKDDVRKRLKEIYGENEAVSDLMLDNVFAVADRDHSGTISIVEQMVVRFAARDMLEHVVTGEEFSTMMDVAKTVLGNDEENPNEEALDEIVRQMQQVLDEDGSGTFNREEMLHALGEVTGKDFLG